MIIGITGTDGAGENVWDTFARGCLVFCEVMKQNTDNLYCSCKERVRKYVGCTQKNFHTIHLFDCV